MSEGKNCRIDMITHHPRKQARDFQEDSLGFTIIELLIVIIVIAILSALALPSFLNQANKAKQSEAKTYIGSMNRAQQVAFMENGDFTMTSGELGLGVAEETSSYIYRITLGSEAGKNVVNRAIPSDGTFSGTQSSTATFSAYIGGVKAGTLASVVGEPATLAVLCEAVKPPSALGNNGTSSEPINLSSVSPGAPTCDLSIYREVK